MPLIRFLMILALSGIVICNAFSTALTEAAA
jgi:hypothetical protein